MNLEQKIEAKMKDIKASKSKASPEIQKDKLQNKIQAAKKLRETYNKPIKGRGAVLLENIGKLLQSSGSEGYSKCVSPEDAATVFLKDFNYFAETYQEPIKYQSDNSILIYIESSFYLITISEMKVAIPQMAVNAGCPVQLTSGSFRKIVLEGMLKTFQRLDPTFDEISKTILGK